MCGHITSGRPAIAGASPCKEPISVQIWSLHHVPAPTHINTHMDADASTQPPFCQAVLQMGTLCRCVGVPARGRGWQRQVKTFPQKVALQQLAGVEV